MDGGGEQNKPHPDDRLGELAPLLRLGRVHVERTGAVRLLRRCASGETSHHLWANSSGKWTLCTSATALADKLERLPVVLICAIKRRVIVNRTRIPAQLTFGIYQERAFQDHAHPSDQLLRAARLFICLFVTQSGFILNSMGITHI